MLFKLWWYKIIRWVVCRYMAAKLSCALLQVRLKSEPGTALQLSWFYQDRGDK